jgi:uncharacterized protein YdeI (YjbR/CyaY-like superfamily)
MPRAENALKFKATLERANNNLGWVIARVPVKVSAALGGRGQIRVKGQIAAANSWPAPFAFRTTLFPDGRGGHYLLVNKAMQKGGRVKQGSLAEIRLQFDRERRTIKMPREMERALNEDRQLRRWFDEKLTPSMRRDIARTIGQLKSAEARRRRSEQLAERLMFTMEAERELPPMLRLALARDYKAAEGWKLMSATQRRWHLLGIFGYRTPESQGRRLAKAMNEMVARFEKQQAKSGDS